MTIWQVLEYIQPTRVPSKTIAVPGTALDKLRQGQMLCDDCVYGGMRWALGICMHAWCGGMCMMCDVVCTAALARHGPPVDVYVRRVTGLCWLCMATLAAWHCASC